MTYISRSEFDRAVLHVRGTGVPATLEAKLASPMGGRPRDLSVEVLFAGMLLSSTHKKNLLHTSIYSVLAGLAGNVRRHYGIEHLKVWQVRYLISAITDLYENTPLRRPEMSTTERFRRRNQLQELVDSLVGHTIKDVPSTGSYAIDNTAIDTTARLRGRRKDFNQHVTTIHAKKPLHDVDARTGYRTETYANRTHWVYGYQMGALSRVAPEDAPGSVPHLIDRIFLVPGNEAGLPETVEALDSLRESGAPVREVLVDKGYSQAAFDDFSGPMHERNIDIVMDLKKDQHTVVPNDDIGYLILDGQAFCPTLPPRLRNLHLVEDLTAKNPEGRTHITAEEQQAWDERAAARKEFMQLIAERNTYRLESKGPARNRKGIRYVCPVTTGRLDVSTHPAPHLRKECCRKSITIPFSVHGKLRQKHVWGTREWFRSYARRTAVERFFGNIKGLTGIMRAGWTLQVGLVKLQLMTAITVMAHNLKTLLRWTKAHGANGSFIAAIEVAEVEIIDPSPGIDPASLPEHLQPA